MNIPQAMQINYCTGCQRSVYNENFRYCGVDAETGSFFFDYLCSNCGHHGRFIIEVVGEHQVHELLRMLADVLEYGAPYEPPPEPWDAT